jgi:hypothetical protein
MGSAPEPGEAWRPRGAGLAVSWFWVLVQALLHRSWKRGNRPSDRGHLRIPRALAKPARPLWLRGRWPQHPRKQESSVCARNSDIGRACRPRRRAPLPFCHMRTSEKWTWKARSGGASSRRRSNGMMATILADPITGTRNRAVQSVLSQSHGMHKYQCRRRFAFASRN